MLLLLRPVRRALQHARGELAVWRLLLLLLLLLPVLLLLVQ